jgi:hypothetical protein
MILRICAPSPRKKIVARKTANKNQDQDWEAATWEGSRRVQIRAALAMTLRQRFQALEELSELAQKLASMPRTSVPPTKKNRASR